MRHNFILIFFGLLALVNAQEECGECNRSDCPPLEFCAFGIEKDPCNCCQVCSKRLGEICDLDISSKKHGNCGEFLICTEGDEPSVGACECSDPNPVCGSDDITYDNLCKFLEKAQNNVDLNVVDRSPCKKGPVIKSPPKDARRALNSILLLDCEVYGIPVPTITWELNKPDGSTLQLPSDDPNISVQVRGGPEENMATGWVQIMKITPDNVGIYTCVATNTQGESRSSANVTHKKKSKKKYPKKA